MNYFSKNYIESKKIISSDTQKRRKISFSSNRYELSKNRSLQRRSNERISSNLSLQSLQYHPYTVKNIKSKEKFIIRERGQNFVTLPQQVGRQRSQITIQFPERIIRRKLKREKNNQSRLDQQIRKLKKEVEEVHGNPIDFEKAKKIGTTKKQEFYKQRMRISSIRIICRMINRKLQSQLTQSFNLMFEKAFSSQL